VPVNASANQAVKALMAAGQGCRRQLVVAAQAFRKRRQMDESSTIRPVENPTREKVEKGGNHPGNHPRRHLRNRRRVPREPPWETQQLRREPLGEPPGTTSGA
jgi:hypothetical protein